MHQRGRLHDWMKTFLPEKCVVHGMRHAFRDRLRAVNAPMDMIDQLGGRTAKSASEAYGLGFSPAQTSCFLLKALPESAF